MDPEKQCSGDPYVKHVWMISHYTLEVQRQQNRDAQWQN